MKLTRCVHIFIVNFINYLDIMKETLSVSSHNASTLFIATEVGGGRDEA